MIYKLDKFDVDYGLAQIAMNDCEDVAKYYMKSPEKWVPKMDIDFEDGMTMGFLIELDSLEELSEFIADCKHDPLIHKRGFILFSDRNHKWCKETLEKQEAIDREEADKYWNEVFPD